MTTERSERESMLLASVPCATSLILFALALTVRCMDMDIDLEDDPKDGLMTLSRAALSRRRICDTLKESAARIIAQPSSSSSLFSWVFS